MEDFAIRVSGLSKKYSFDKHRTTSSIKERLKLIFTKTELHLGEEKEFYALKDINFEIKRGDSLGLIGRNGAGKSTLLKILSEVVEPTEGKIEIKGTVASVLEVGMGFHPELTGRENVFLSGAMLGISRKHISAKFNEIVEFSGIERFIDTPVKHYSSGMYIRLAFSVVANIDADILLFDEVMNMGDSEFQNKSANKINELISSNKTVVLVSHNMNEIIKLCNKVICLENGAITDEGDPATLVTKYLKNIEDSLMQKMKFVVNDKTLEKVNQEVDGNYKLNFIGLKQNNLLVNKAFTINEPFEISLEIEKLTNINTVFISINFYHYGNVFLSTNSFYTRNKAVEIKDAGNYKLGVIIPERFFNTSLYDVDIYIIDNENETPVALKQALSFKILPDSDEIGNDIYRQHKMFHGPMYTSMIWEKQYTSNQADA